MKYNYAYQLFIVIILFFESAVCIAQTSVYAEPRDVNRKLVIDEVRYRFTYRTMFSEDTVGKAQYYDNQALEIGSKYIRYYSLFAETMDSTKFWHTSGMRQGGSFSLTEDLKPKEVGQYEDIFINYPQSGDMTVYNVINKKAYVYAEPTPLIDWEITGKTDTILGYICQEAIADFRGRTWHVWFTYEIPLHYGPWKLGGLPGLILRAEDSNGLYTYELIGMQQPGNEPMYRYDIQTISCKREDIIRINDLRWKDPEKHALSNGSQGFMPMKRDAATGKLRKMTSAEYAASIRYIPQRELY